MIIHVLMDEGMKGKVGTMGAVGRNQVGNDTINGGREAYKWTSK